MVKELEQLNAEWEKFRHFFKREEMPARIILMKEGKVSDRMFYIEKGCIRLSFNKDGKDITFSVNLALSMEARELIQLKLVNQGLTSAKFKTCADVVSYFSAMQSQDYPMAKWAAGMRVRRASDSDIEMCVNSGDIIRTHILRPTWHFVSCKEIRWMMELSAPNLRKATRYVDRQVGLTDELFKVRIN